VYPITKTIATYWRYGGSNFSSPMMKLAEVIASYIDGELMSSGDLCMAVNRLVMVFANCSLIPCLVIFV
jgi:hypothetical protein